MSMSDWYESDPHGDAFDDYMSGAYDVTCERCKGKRVVEGFPQFTDPAHERDYDRQMEEVEASKAMQRAEIAAEQAFERRIMGIHDY
jgi:hypothetical protein